MSLGVIAGFTTAYPANVLTVKGGLKHGLMTERKPGAQLGDQNHFSGDSEIAPQRNEGHEHQAPPVGGHTERGHEMKSDITPAQLAAVASVSLLALAVGIIAPANWLNVRLSARDVGGAIMPPGMITDRDTPAEAMIDMAAVNPREIVKTYDLDSHGNCELDSARGRGRQGIRARYNGHTVDYPAWRHR